MSWTNPEEKNSIYVAKVTFLKTKNSTVLRENFIHSNLFNILKFRVISVIKKRNIEKKKLRKRKLLKTKNSYLVQLQL